MSDSSSLLLSFFLIHEIFIPVSPKAEIFFLGEMLGPFLCSTQESCLNFAQTQFKEGNSCYHINFIICDIYIIHGIF
jgi:hypothetical protein